MFVSRLLAVQQVRRQMTQIAAQIGQHLRRNELTSDSIRTALAGGGLLERSRSTCATRKEPFLSTWEAAFPLHRSLLRKSTAHSPAGNSSFEPSPPLPVNSSLKPFLCTVCHHPFLHFRNQLRQIQDRCFLRSLCRSRMPTLLCLHHSSEPCHQLGRGTLAARYCLAGRGGPSLVCTRKTARGTNRDRATSSIQALAEPNPATAWLPNLHRIQAIRAGGRRFLRCFSKRDQRIRSSHRRRLRQGDPSRTLDGRYSRRRENGVVAKRSRGSRTRIQKIEPSALRTCKWEPVCKHVLVCLQSATAFPPVCERRSLPAVPD